MLGEWVPTRICRDAFLSHPRDNERINKDKP